MKPFTLRNLYEELLPCTIQGMKPFGDKLKELRLAKGVSLEDLADLIDFNRANYISTEKGRRPASDLLLKKLATFYNLPLSQMQAERDAWEIRKKFSPEGILLAAEDIPNEAFKKSVGKGMTKSKALKILQEEKDKG
jgi:transcriptional regulator with XRE-family HTH domain